MVAKKTQDHATSTSAVLNTLLKNRDRYARTWKVHGGRQRGEINQRAVAHVLALYLWDKGLRPESDIRLPVSLKNVVSRALSGERLTAQTLDLFIGAFDMDEDDQRSLWQAFGGDKEVSYTLRHPRSLIRRQWHRTVALIERYYIDSDKRMTHRRTVQSIEAREDGVTSYLFTRERTVAEIEVIHGGRLGRHHESAEGLIADDIVLDRPLKMGERTSIEYLTTYGSSDLAVEIRRAARRRTENVTLAVHFSPEMIPESTFFAVWDNYYTGSPISMSPSALCVAVLEVCLPSIEETVVGFCWRW